MFKPSFYNIKFTIEHLRSTFVNRRKCKKYKSIAVVNKSKFTFYRRNLLGSPKRQIITKCMFVCSVRLKIFNRFPTDLLQTYHMGQY